MALVPTPSEAFSNVGSGLNQLLSPFVGSRQGSYSKTDTALQAAFNYNAMQEAMAFNSAEAQKNRDWQEKMSNTAYQRAVEDMRKAGINPMLAYTMGGATTPGGASAATGSASIGAEAMSSSFGVSGLAEGIGQIVGALEGLGLTEKAKEGMNYLWNTLNYRVDHNSPTQKNSSDYGGQTQK